MNESLKLSRPLVILDLETTGMSVCRDRIIEYALLRINPDGEIISRTALVHPGMSIPEASTQVHGITDAMVKGKPAFSQIAKELNTFLAGCDIGGYNVQRFDLPMLIEEFHRAGITFDMKGRRIIDSQRIFYAMEPRTLRAAYRYYCKGDMSELGSAHRAEVDTMATYKVLLGQIARYEHEPGPDGKASPITNDMGRIHEFLCDDMVDLSANMILREGEVFMNFGKYRGQSLEKVLKQDPGFYDRYQQGEYPIESKQAMTRARLSLLSRR